MPLPRSGFKWIRNIFILVSLAIFFGLGVWVSRNYFFAPAPPTEEENAEVLLERMQSVAKLITVEGYFSEIYDYKDYWRYDLGMFRKKALLRVRAKVSVGYDLGNISIEALPENRTIVISNLPDPTILSIDHDIDYYDIQEGVFNSFSESDYTKLNRRAKTYIEEKARSSDLLLSAEKQGNDLLDLMRFMAESAGWKVVFQPRETPLPDIR